MDKVKLCMLGCGGISGTHARRMRDHPDVRIVGLCDVSQPVVESYIERNLNEYQPTAAIFTDPARMYADTDADAVLIATPHTLHFDQGMEALAAGLHVYMEKPMVTAADQAYALARKVQESGKVFVIGYNTPCTPEFNYLRQQIRDKALGSLELVSGWLTQGWMTATVGTWRQNPELSGGGQAYDSGAHILNSLCWSVESDIDQVLAFTDNKSAPVDVNSSINIRFTNGVLATIIIGGNCPTDASQMMYAFDEGRIDIDGWSGSWINVFDRQGQVKYPQITGKLQVPNDNFIDAILGRAEPRTSAQNGIVHSELMDAIYESARTGKAARPKRQG